MYLIVGLGNPGESYVGSRHNVGFVVLDLLADRVGSSFADRKFKARLARATLAGQDCWLIKPQGYMNLSGESVGPCSGFYHIPHDRIVVVHDDIDLPVGRLRLKKGGGHGGHNGIRSIMQHSPSPDFVRVRVGVGRPPAGSEGVDHVLGRFRSEERALIADACEAAADAVEAILRDGLARAMNHYNRDPEKAQS